MTKNDLNVNEKFEIGDYFARYATNDHTSIVYIGKMTTESAMQQASVIITFGSPYKCGDIVMPWWEYCKKISHEEAIFIMLQQGGTF